MKVALAAIVKNEAHVIERMLRSHKDVVQHFVICDTGSTDGTQDVIIRTAQHLGIPCDLYQDEWVDFGHNRTLMMKRAKGIADYILVNDADHIWHGRLPPVLEADCYSLEYNYHGVRYGVCCLLSDRFDWEYVGVLHEYVKGTPDPKPAVALGCCSIEVRHEGARSRDPDTYRKDAAILEKAFAEEPNNQRYAFYLAQSYRDSNQLDKALEMYRKRIAMPGWDQETWYCYYVIGIILEMARAPAEKVTSAYLEAYNYRPSRAEPLHRLARYHRMRNELGIAFLYASHAASMPHTTDGLFVEEEVYQWRALDELTVAAWYCGRKDLGKVAAETLMKRRFPESERKRIEDTHRWYSQDPIDKAAA